MAAITVQCGNTRHIIRDRAAWLIQYIVSTSEMMEDVNRAAHGQAHFSWGGGDQMEGWVQAFYPKRRPE